MIDFAPLRKAIAMLWRIATCRFFLTLLAIDFIFIAIHLYVATRPWEVETSPIEYLRIDKDRGLSEWFEYAMLAWGAFAIAERWRQSRDSVAALFTALLVYLLIDDSFSIHEVLGPMLEAKMPALGEMLPSLVMGIIFLSWWSVLYLRGGETERVKLSAIAITMAYIVFFGVIVDTAHGILIPPHHPLDGPITVIEDGNELIGLTFIGVLALSWAPIRSPARSLALAS